MRQPIENTTLSTVSSSPHLAFTSHSEQDSRPNNTSEFSGGKRAVVFGNRDSSPRLRSFLRLFATHFQTTTTNNKKMKFGLWLVLVSLAKVTEALTEEQAQRSVFPGRNQPPGLNARHKCWWAKEITPWLHTAGWLSERQIKYAADAGFKSLVSVFTFSEDEGAAFRRFGTEDLPYTAEAESIATNVAGLKFAKLGVKIAHPFSVEGAEELAKVVSTLPRPVLLYCARDFTTKYVSLMYLARETVRDPSFTPQITSLDFYRISAATGLDFRSLNKTVSNFTGSPTPQKLPSSDVEPKTWYMDYWLPHPVHKNWFIAGQISKSHVPLLKTVFRSVVNLRRPVMLDGNPSQEEVNLLNVKDSTGTYASDGHKARQSPCRLRDTRIDPSRPNSYISSDSSVNYERINEEEFGDAVGYNESNERKAFENWSSGNYYNLPLDLDDQFEDFMTQHRTTLLELGEKGAVLVHCSSAMRAAYVTVLTAALQYNHGMEWALKRLRELGFHQSQTQLPQVYQTYQKLLVKKEA